MSTISRASNCTPESAFSNTFKRTVGMAPKRYREAAGQVVVEFQSQLRRLYR